MSSKKAMRSYKILKIALANQLLDLSEHDPQGASIRARVLPFATTFAYPSVRVRMHFSKENFL